jgi:hypothetical protein
VVVLVTDVRFDNEAEKLKELGAVILKIHRPDTELWQVASHASEGGVSEKYIDFVVENKGTVDEFRQSLYTALAGVLPAYVEPPFIMDDLPWEIDDNDRNNDEERLESHS